MGKHTKKKEMTRGRKMLLGIGGAIVVFAGASQVFAATIFGTDMLTMYEDLFNGITPGQVATVDNQINPTSQKYVNDMTQFVQNQINQAPVDLNQFTNSQINQGKNNLDAYESQAKSELTNDYNQALQQSESQIQQEVNNDVANIETQMKQAATNTLTNATANQNK